MQWSLVEQRYVKACLMSKLFALRPFYKENELRERNEIQSNSPRCRWDTR